MSITSFQFLGFALITVILYFLIPRRFQWLVILAANMFFYASCGKRFLIYITVFSMVAWLAALRIDDVTDLGSKLLSVGGSTEIKKEIRTSITSLKKLLCGIAVTILLLIWVFIKYGTFFAENINRLLPLLGKQWTIEIPHFILPLGMSFYTFHCVGYLVDVYRRKYPAEKNYFKYLTFVSYFPHIIQGPFSRFDDLGKSIFEPHSFSYERLCEGCARILWGLVKKLLLADILGKYVNLVFGDYTSYTGAYIVLAFWGYAIQIYADFSGYMDIVCGLSHILGISLAENFKRPYFAKSVEEYWRRWHITLGKWFKDYVFMPVSMGSVGQKLGQKARAKWGARMGKLVPGYFALIFVWTATGLWHGADWKYLIWGYLNLLVILSTMQLKTFYDKVKKILHIKSEGLLWGIFCMLRTFCLVSFFRMFSVAESLSTAVSMIRFAFGKFGFGTMVGTLSAFVRTYASEGFFTDKQHTDWLVIVIIFIMVCIVDVLSEAGKWDAVKIHSPFVLRDVVYVLLILMLVLFAGGDNDLTKGFMYAVF